MRISTGGKKKRFFHGNRNLKPERYKNKSARSFVGEDYFFRKAKSAAFLIPFMFFCWNKNFAKLQKLRGIKYLCF